MPPPPPLAAATACRHAVRHRIDDARAAQSACELEGGDGAIVHATCESTSKAATQSICQFSTPRHSARSNSERPPASVSLGQLAGVFWLASFTVTLLPTQVRTGGWRHRRSTRQVSSKTSRRPRGARPSGSGARRTAWRTPRRRRRGRSSESSSAGRRRARTGGCNPACAGCNPMCVQAGTLCTQAAHLHISRSSLLSWAKLGSADYVELKMVLALKCQHAKNGGYDAPDGRWRSLLTVPS